MLNFVLGFAKIQIVLSFLWNKGINLNKCIYKTNCFIFPAKFSFFAHATF